jgi:hypothetical protein
MRHSTSDEWIDNIFDQVGYKKTTSKMLSSDIRTLAGISKSERAEKKTVKGS